MSEMSATDQQQVYAKVLKVLVVSGSLLVTGLLIAGAWVGFSSGNAAGLTVFIAIIAGFVITLGARASTSEEGQDVLRIVATVAISIVAVQVIKDMGGSPLDAGAMPGWSISLSLEATVVVAAFLIVSVNTIRRLDGKRVEESLTRIEKALTVQERLRASTDLQR